MARILFVSHTSDLDGASICLLKLLKYIGLQHEVAVAVPDDGELVEALEEMRIPAHWPEQHGLTKRSIPWLWRLIVGREVDLVYGNNYSSGPRNALIAAKLTGRPFVWHIREMLKKERATHWRTAFFLPYANVLIADSQACAETVKHHVSKKEVHPVYNGIDLEDFNLEIAEARRQVRDRLGVPSEQLVIANVGIVCARKGQAYAIEVATEILKDHPKVTFAFLGRLDVELEYAQPLRVQAKQSKLEGKIQFLGFHKDIPRFLVGSDILLHTAARDPHPRAVLEGMGAGLPVVAFAVDGVKEQVVDGETGYLIPFGNVNAMVEALKELLGNPSLRKRIGKMGRRRVETVFTAERTGRQISGLIHDVLAGGAEPGTEG